jgi:hypothetical protein
MAKAKKLTKAEKELAEKEQRAKTSEEYFAARGLNKYGNPLLTEEQKRRKAAEKEARDSLPTVGYKEMTLAEKGDEATRRRQMLNDLLG